MLLFAFRHKTGGSVTTYANGWPYRHTAIGQPVALGLTVSLSPLVLFIPRTHPDLRSAGNSGRVQSTAGNDLRWELRTGGKLPHELAFYAPTTGQTGSFVRLANVDPTETITLDLYFGRSGLAGTEADPVGCWAGSYGVIDLATGADVSGNNAGLTMTGITATTLLGMPAADFSPTSAPVTAPTTGTITSFTSNDTVSVSGWTISTHNSTTGNLVVLFGTRSNAGPSPTVTSVTWDGTALTLVNSPLLNGAGRGIGFTGYIRGGSTGTHNLVITMSTGSARDLCGWVVDINNMAPSTLGAHNAVATNVSESSETATLTTTNASSLLLGAVFAYDGTVSPMSVSAGWTERAEAQSGAGAADIVGVLGSRSAGSVGSISFTGSSDAPTATDNWVALAIELLPA